MDHLAPIDRDRTLDSLAESLASEARLLTQLVAVLREQREGVARDDVEQVDDSVHAAHRVMHTLAEARRRRNTLLHVLTDRWDLQVNDLADALGAHMTPALDACREELEAVARAVSREVALNRAVLTRAIRTGNEYVQRLVAPTAAGYGGRGEYTMGARESAVINQRV